MFGAYYRRATWTAWLVNAFHVLSGPVPVAVYLMQLLVTLEKESNGEFPMSPAVGILVNALINLVDSLLAFVPLLLFGRKTLF